MNPQIIINAFNDFICYLFGHKKQSSKYGAFTQKGYRHYICDRCNERLTDKL